MEGAIRDISAAQATAVTLLTNYSMSREQTLPMLFSQDTIAAAANARGIVQPLSMTKAYELVPGVRFIISYETASVLPIEEEALKVDPALIGPLYAYLDDVKRVHTAYEEVKGVLRWLNRNATPGAIRYYWPSAMKLTKDAPIWRDLQDVPSRYTSPPGVTDWLQSFKDSAATVTSMLMLPNDAAARPRSATSTMWLVCPSGTVQVGPSGVHRYATDQIVYNTN